MLKPAGTLSFAVGSLSGAAGIGGGAFGASLAAASLPAGRPINGDPGGSAGAAAGDAPAAGGDAPAFVTGNEGEHLFGSHLGVPLRQPEEPRASGREVHGCGPEVEFPQAETGSVQCPLQARLASWLPALAGLVAGKKVRYDRTKVEADRWAFDYSPTKNGTLGVTLSLPAGRAEPVLAATWLLRWP